MLLVTSKCEKVKKLMKIDEKANTDSLLLIK